jgi:hypothetical protein
MVPLPVVVSHELVEGAEEPTLPDEEQAVETLLSDRAHEAFRVGVGIRRPDGYQHDPHPGALDDAAEVVGPLAVATAEEDLVVPVRNLIRARLTLRDARSGRLDLPSAPLVNWIGERPTRNPRGRGVEPTGEVRHLTGSGSEARGRARPRSGDALVAVMEPADLRNGHNPAP